MQEYREYDSSPFSTPEQEANHGMATLAFIFGTCSIITNLFMPIILPCFLGGMAIILAILSKGSARRMSRLARRGIICAVIGLLTTVYLTVHVLIPSAIAQLKDPDYRQFMNQVSENLYGTSFDDMLGQIDALLGTNLEDLDKGGTTNGSEEII